MARWLDVSEAAEALGVSIYTVKRRAKAGDIPAEQRETPTGFKWYVQVDEDAATAPLHQTEASDTAASWETAVAALQQANDQLQQQNEKLWTELESRRREVSELHILLQREQESKRPQLAPPADYITAIAAPEQPLQQVLQQNGSGHKAWWKLW